MDNKVIELAAHRTPRDPPSVDVEHAEVNVRMNDAPSIAKTFQLYASPKSFRVLSSACLLMVRIEGIWRAEIRDIAIWDETPSRALRQMLVMMEQAAWEHGCTHITVDSREVIRGSIDAAFQAIRFERDGAGGFRIDRNRRRKTPHNT